MSGQSVRLDFKDSSNVEASLTFTKAVSGGQEHMTSLLTSLAELQKETNEALTEVVEAQRRSNPDKNDLETAGDQDFDSSSEDEEAESEAKKMKM